MRSTDQNSGGWRSTRILANRPKDRWLETLGQIWQRQSSEMGDTPSRRLAIAVLMQAVKDARHDTLKGNEALDWLTTPSGDLQLWCDQAGIQCIPSREHLLRWREGANGTNQIHGHSPADVSSRAQR